MARSRPTAARLAACGARSIPFRGVSLRSIEGQSVPHPALLVAAVGIFLLSLCVRMPAATWGLPYLYPWDEAQIANFSIRMVEDRDPNPRAFLYPSLPLYAYALADIVALRMGMPSGVLDPHSPAWRATSADEWNLPQTALLRLHRGVTIVVGSLLAVAVFLLGVCMGAPAGGLLAGVVVAMSPSAAAGCARTNVDTWMGLFSVLALVPMTVSPPSRGSLRASALLAGMAAACKYPAGLVVLPALVAASRNRDHGRRRVLELSCICTLTFLACSPFLLLDPSTALRDMAFQIYMYGVSGHPGAEHGRGFGNLAFHLRHVAGALGPAGWFAALGTGLLLKHERGGRAVLLFSGSYLLFMSVQKVAAARNMEPVVALAAVVAGVGAEVLLRRLRSPAPAVMVLGLALGLGVSRLAPLAEARLQWTRPDSRLLATRWLAEQPADRGGVASEIHLHGEHLAALPPNTKVAPAESLSRWLETGALTWALLPTTPSRPDEQATRVASDLVPGAVPRCLLTLGSSTVTSGPPVDPAIELWTWDRAANTSVRPREGRAGSFSTGFFRVIAQEGLP